VRTLALEMEPANYCIYISTETNFPIDRFNQLIYSQSDQEQIRNRILLQSFDHLDAFENCILHTLKDRVQLLKKMNQNVKLIVIDFVFKPII